MRAVVNSTTQHARMQVPSSVRSNARSMLLTVQELLHRADSIGSVPHTRRCYVSSSPSFNLTCYLVLLAVKRPIPHELTLLREGYGHTSSRLVVTARRLASGALPRSSSARCRRSQRASFLPGGYHSTRWGSSRRQEVQAEKDGRLQRWSWEMAERE